MIESYPFKEQNVPLKRQQDCKTEKETTRLEITDHGISFIEKAYVECLTNRDGKHLKKIKQSLKE